jgi:hypothetical protein
VLKSVTVLFTDMVGFTISACTARLVKVRQQTMAQPTIIHEQGGRQTVYFSDDRHLRQCLTNSPT